MINTQPGQILFRYLFGLFILDSNSTQPFTTTTTTTSAASSESGLSLQHSLVAMEIIDVDDPNTDTVPDIEYIRRGSRTASTRPVSRAATDDVSSTVAIAETSNLTSTHEGGSN